MKINELETLQMANDLLSLMEHQSLTKTELCRVLTLRTFRPLDAVATSLIELNSDGTYRGDHAYGLSELEASEWTHIPLSENRPPARAIVENRPVWVDIAGGGLTEYPLTKQAGFEKIARSQVVWPVNKAGVPVGAISVFFNKSIHVSDTALSYLELIAHIVALRLTSPVDFSPEPEVEVKPATPYDKLTEREAQVLKGISEYATNAQIAEELGFSESTIRQDTIQIYRKMGVAGRDEARKRFLNAVDS